MTNSEEQTQANSAPPARPRKRIFIPILIGVGIIIIILAVIAFLGKRAPTITFPADLAKLAPADSVAYLCFDARPILARQKEFAPTIDAWEESAAIAQAREGLEEELRATGISLQEDILPWLGPVYAIAMTEMPEFDVPFMPPMSSPGMGYMVPPMSTAPTIKRIPTFLAILTARDMKKARDSLASIAEKAGMQATKESYQDVELLRLSSKNMPHELIYATTESLVLISNQPEQVKAALDRSNGAGDSLTDAEAYQQVIPKLAHPTQDQVVTYYLDLAAFAKGMEKMLPGGAFMPFTLQPYEYIDSFAGGVIVSPDKIEMESVSWGRKQADDPMRKIISALPPVGGRAFQFLPKESVVALAIPSPAAYWQIFEQLFKASSKDLPVDPIAEMEKGLKQASGLDFKEDIIGWMSGEFALSIFDVRLSPDQATPGTLPLDFALIIEDKDEATLQAKLATLRSAVQSLIKKQGFPMPVSWQKKRSGEATYHILVMPGFPVSLCLGQVGKIAVLTSSPSALEKVLAAARQTSDSIVENPTFKRLKETLPSDPMSLVFAEPSRIVAEVEGEPGANVVASFKSLAAAEALIPDGSRSLTYIEVDLAEFIKALDSTISQGRGKSRQANCLSDVRQITTAMMMFAADHDDRLPEASRWTEEIQPYLTSQRALCCLNDSSGAKSSYGMNAALSGKKLSDMPNPESTVLVFEAAHPGPNPRGDSGAVAVPPRHEGGNNFGFVDGHVMVLKETPTF
ncbi:MAG: DUF3352 domain-containing protein [Armatimonadetes bacterium]|nr:DUF3352 domain-containing protein [Armatimonadota bacterium]NIO75576.1 DUF3352 domain-containing protein [Armatimonadota bacterium]NIO98104.1 DUF3352 domain-containing protein [Armatimonadota bacterium]